MCKNLSAQANSRKKHAAFHTPHSVGFTAYLPTHEFAASSFPSSSAVEQLTVNQRATGSNPVSGAKLPQTRPLNWQFALTRQQAVAASTACWLLSTRNYVQPRAESSGFRAPFTSSHPVIPNSPIIAGASTIMLIALL